jgi:hypothetical protein
LSPPMQFVYGSGQGRAASLDPKKMRGRFTLKKLFDSAQLLADTIPRGL